MREKYSSVKADTEDFCFYILFRTKVAPRTARWLDRPFGPPSLFRDRGLSGRFFDGNFANEFLFMSLLTINPVPSPHAVAG
jgi:hypothetical protein